MMSILITEKTERIGETESLWSPWPQWLHLPPRRAEREGTREGAMRGSAADLQGIENIEMIEIEDTTQDRAKENAGAEVGSIEGVSTKETTEEETIPAQGEKREGAIMREAGQEAEMRRGADQLKLLLKRL